MLIDTHIHIDFMNDLPKALQVARSTGITGWVVPGVEPQHWPRLRDAVKTTRGAWAAPGVHPLAAADWRSELAGTLRHLADAPSTVAIGEVGLDRNAGPDLAIQEQVFRQMIRIARESGRPLILHCRGAIGRLLQILRAEGARDIGGIAHAFTGSIESARQLIDLGFALGIGGVVTYPEAHRLSEVVRQAPADWLVLESDAPDLAPHPYRGQANRPEWLTLIAARLTALRGWDPDETARVTTANAQRVLRLPMTAKTLPS